MLAAHLIATGTGFATMMALLPLALFPPFFAVFLMIGLPMAFVLVMPVTLLLLPATVFLLVRQKIDQPIILPLVGFIGGAVVAGLVFSQGRISPAEPDAWWRFAVAGGVAGLVAGCFYAQKTRPVAGARLSSPGSLY